MLTGSAKTRVSLLLLVAAIPAPLSGEEIVLGMSAAFDGPSGGLGTKFWHGSDTYFRSVNDSGGIHGRNIRIERLNDGYDPNSTVRNTVTFLESRRVFLLYGYVGAPTVTRVLPLLKIFQPRDAYMFFPLTGAEPPRAPPYGAFVFNLRASYQQETEGLVGNLVAMGRKRIAVFYQNDAFGRSGWEGVRKALARRNLALAADASYRRGTSYDSSLAEQVNLIGKANVDAVISVGVYAPCAAFVRDARDRGLAVPILNLSFVGSKDFIDLLTAAGKSSGKDYTRDLVVSQVVPSYDDVDLPGVKEYRALTDRYDGAAGSGYSFIGFEGFLSAKLLAEVLRKLGPSLDRSRLRAAAESIGTFDLGIGAPASFAPGRHQALDQVYYTTVETGRFRPLRNWDRWRR